MRIIADHNITGLEQTFARHAEIKTVNGRDLERAQLLKADALIVRSVTQVNEALLHDTPVAFVGTATIGTDHLDVDWLDQNHIRWASTPSCNADAAAQYSLAMIALACARADIDLRALNCGVVGRGNVGGRLQAMLTGLGMETLACDPPLAEAGVSGLVSLADITDCNLVSFHVPLTRLGSHPTFGMLDTALLEQLRPGTLIVNASRGDVVCGPALLNWLERGRGHAALDVWPGEPHPDPALVRNALVATPHVAGYSVDGKLRGTVLLYQAFLDWLDSRSEHRRPAQHETTTWQLPLGEHLLPDCPELTECLLQACTVRSDDRKLRSILQLQRGARGQAFDQIRQDYPMRRDFRGWRLPDTMAAEMRRTLRNLGFVDSQSIDIEDENV